jgi:D-serine deaminase-like pyridoxal phosphate-dependent protein
MEISKPTFLINTDQVGRNIDKMINIANKSDALFRPHFKTHQSIEVGKVFKKKGINKISVSSLSMAKQFAGAGWDDITIAFPLNIRELDKIDALARTIKLKVVVDSLYSVNYLSKHITHSLDVFVKIDVGYHRCGLDFESEDIDKIAEAINESEHLDLTGFLTHAGHNYNAKGKQEIEQNVLNAIEQFEYLRKKFPDTLISWGDTPSCSASENLGYFDELRPGNFVYYDLMQYHIGSCSLKEIAVAVLCPVVSVNISRNEIVIYGGAVHLSKEFIAADNNFKLFGYVARFENGKWGNPLSGAYVSSLSQEHGIIRMPPELINTFNPGDIVGVLPIHSCLSANLLINNSLLI